VVGVDVRQIGPYRLERLLGFGGMGEVHLAYDTVRDRMVALKLLSEALSKDTDYQRRFRRESHVAARLREPHVIPIHDYGEVDGQLFIDMRLVDGQNVRQILSEGGAMPAERAVHIVGQVADALEAAHADGLVHRDIKPSNVLVTANDFVYVVDFGIARSVGTERSSLTLTGVTVGTLDYMAPERFARTPIDGRADVYSLACLLHECLTGTPPFAGDDLPSLMYAHLFDDPPRPTATVASLPAAMDAVIATGMAKQLDARYASPTALADAARAALGGASAPRSPARSGPAGDARADAARVPAEAVLSRDEGDPARSADPAAASRRGGSIAPAAGEPPSTVRPPDRPAADVPSAVPVLTGRATAAAAASGAVSPDAARSGAVPPDAVSPDAARSGAASPDAASAGAVSPGAVAPDAARSGAASSGAASSGAVSPDAVAAPVPDAGPVPGAADRRPEASDAARPDRARSDPARSDPARSADAPSAAGAPVASGGPVTSAGDLFAALGAVPMPGSPLDLPADPDPRDAASPRPGAPADAVASGARSAPPEGGGVAGNPDREVTAAVVTERIPATAAQDGPTVVVGPRPVVPPPRPAGPAAQPPDPRRPARRRGPLLTMAAVVAVAAMIVVATLVFVDRTPVANPLAVPPPADAPGKETVVSIAVPTVRGSIPVGPTPGYLEVAPNGRFAYIANRDAGIVTVLDTAINQVTATIPIAAGPPQFVTFSPDGLRAYLSIYNTERTINLIGVVDTGTNAVVQTIPVGRRPFASATTPDGSRLYVPSHDDGRLDVIDTGSGTVVAQVPVARNPHWVAFAPDGSRLYTANHESNVVSVLDPANDSVITTIPVGTSPHSTTLSPDGTRVAVVNYDSDEVSVIDTATNAVVATVPVGASPQDIAYSADGRFLYTADVEADAISVISTETYQVTATIPVGDGPTSVVVSRDGRTGYVTLLNDGSVVMLDLTAG
jgi:YVTN family beta-propeller protein